MMVENAERDLSLHGSKDAVETAIDISKADRRSTWEEVVSREPERIPRWSESSSGSHPSAPSKAARTLADVARSLRRR